MGVVVAFPRWQVITRDEGFAPGDPVAVVDPAGGRHPVLEVLRRRLVATSDPADRFLHEVTVRTPTGRLLLRWREGDDHWDVVPL